MSLKEFLKESVARKKSGKYSNHRERYLPEAPDIDAEIEFLKSNGFVECTPTTRKGRSSAKNVHATVNVLANEPVNTFSLVSTLGGAETELLIKIEGLPVIFYHQHDNAGKYDYYGFLVREKDTVKETEMKTWGMFKWTIEEEIK